MFPAPRSLFPGRALLTRRGSQFLAVASLALAATAQVTGEGQTPEHFDTPVQLPVVAQGQLSPGHQFTAAVCGLLNADAVPDIAVLADGVVHVLINPGLWTAHMELPSEGVLDLALLPRASSIGDGLVSADAAGLLLWRWQKDPLPGFVAHPLSAAGSHPLRVFTAALDLSPAPTPDQLQIGVLDDANFVHCLAMLEGGSPESPPVTWQYVQPWPLPTTPQDLAWFDPFGLGMNLLAVSDASGLRIHAASGGAPAFSWPASVASSYLVPIENDSDSNLAQRMAWVRRLVGNTNYKVQVADVGGLEAVDNLGVTDVTSASTGAAHASAVGGQVARADLTLGLGSGGTSVRLNDRGDPGSLSGTTFPLGGNSELDASPASAAPWTSLGRPLLADFDADGWDDVLRWDDAQGVAKLCLRLPDDPGNAIATRGLQLRTNPPQLVNGNPVLYVDVDTPAFTDIQVIVWAGQGEDPWTSIELLSSSVGYRAESFGQSPQTRWTSVPPIELALDENDLPPVIGVELRLRNSGRPVGTAAYLVTASCVVYTELVCNQDNPGYGIPQDPVEGTCEECDAPTATPPPPPGGVTDLLGGVMPTPRLPPFVGNAVPIINI